MDTQNITLSLPKDLLLKVKLIAVHRRTSVSGLLAETLEKIVEQADAYTRAQRRHLEWLSMGADLGTEGRPASGREELHERG